MTTVEENIVQAIQTGKAKMHPRWYFALRTAFAATGTVILFIFILYFASFLIFALHQSGAWFAPGIGLSGWYLLFISLPWTLLLLSLLFIILLMLLVRHYAFVYHQPMLYILFAIILIVGAGSVFVATTTLHPVVMEYAERDHLPFVNAFYSFESEGPSAIHHGNIIFFGPNGFVIQDTVDRETSTVVFLPTSSFAVGDAVIVIGEENASNTIIPVAVKKVTE